MPYGLNSLVSIKKTEMSSIALNSNLKDRIIRFHIVLTRDALTFRKLVFIYITWKFLFGFNLK